jgi:hypothetical protein
VALSEPRTVEGKEKTDIYNPDANKRNHPISEIKCAEAMREVVLQSRTPPTNRSTEELTNMAVMNVELLKLGRRIRASRKMLGWSQKDFSSQCGLDRSYFGGVERGERNVTFSSLCQICTGLDCDIAAVTKGIPYRTDAPK